MIIVDFVNNIISEDHWKIPYKSHWACDIIIGKTDFKIQNLGLKITLSFYIKLLSTPAYI